MRVENLTHILYYPECISYLGDIISRHALQMEKHFQVCGVHICVGTLCVGIGALGRHTRCWDLSHSQTPHIYFDVPIFLVHMILFLQLFLFRGQSLLHVLCHLTRLANKRSVEGMGPVVTVRDLLDRHETRTAERDIPSFHKTPIT